MINDEVIPTSTDNITVDGYQVGIVNIADYSPFGVELDGRTISNGNYRYGFQGQETDDEIKGEGNSVNYKYRMHDPRIGRFFAVDPLTPNYPFYTPYSFSGNKVINSIEVEGLEEYNVIRNWTKNPRNNGYSLTIKLVYILPKDRVESSSGAKDKDRKADMSVNGQRIPFTGEFKKASVESNWEQTTKFVSPSSKSGEWAGSADFTLKSSVENNKNEHMWIPLEGEKKAGPRRQWNSLSSTTNVPNITVSYSTNGYESNDQEKAAINNAAYYLYFMPEVSINILGNTSRLGTEASNLKLSQSRANNMQIKILEAAKILGASVDELKNIKSRINAVGRGEASARIKGGVDGEDDASDRNTKIIYKIK